MTQALTATTVAAMDLEDGGQLPPFATTIGNPTIGIRLLSGDGMSPGTSAVWTCDQGGLRYDGLPGAEAGFIVDGLTRFTEDGGDAIELGAGDGFLLPKGWTGTIEILAPTRKVFFLLSE